MEGLALVSVLNELKLKPAETRGDTPIPMLPALTASVIIPVLDRPKDIDPRGVVRVVVLAVTEKSPKLLALVIPKDTPPDACAPINIGPGP